jgi:hypothetical protein
LPQVYDIHLKNGWESNNGEGGMPITFITFEDGVCALHGLLVMQVVCLVNKISKLQNQKQCTHKHER